MVLLVRVVGMSETEVEAMMEEGRKGMRDRRIRFLLSGMNFMT